MFGCEFGDLWVVLMLLITLSGYLCKLVFGGSGCL